MQVIICRRKPRRGKRCLKVIKPTAPYGWTHLLQPRKIKPQHEHYKKHAAETIAHQLKYQTWNVYPLKICLNLNNLERSLADSTTAKNFFMLTKTVGRHGVMLIFKLQEAVIAYVRGSTKKKLLNQLGKRLVTIRVWGMSTGLAGITIVEAILTSSRKFLYANLRLWNTCWVIND